MARDAPATAIVPPAAPPSLLVSTRVEVPRVIAPQAAPHMAMQCGAPASPISSAVAASVVDIAASEDARELRAGAVGLQVAVEHHRHGAHEEPALRGDLDAGIVEEDQP